MRNATVIGLPNTGERLLEHVRGAGAPSSSMLSAKDMADAVTLAHSLAHERSTRGRSVVLLSPAAPSYNAYRNFEERGAHFRSLIPGSGP